MHWLSAVNSIYLRNEHTALVALQNRSLRPCLAMYDDENLDYSFTYFKHWINIFIFLTIMIFTFQIQF